MGDNKRKLLLTLLIVGVLGSIAAIGTYSAFVATTTNSGNSFAAGTVAIVDDSGQATALFNNVTNQGPGHTTERCIRVRYTGSLASTVHMFIPSASNASQFQVTVDRGTGMTASDLTNRTCSGFSSTSTAFATDDLSNFPSAYSPSGLAGKAADAAWAQNDAVDYRITLQPKDDATPNAHTSAVTTTFTITWEAHSN